MGEIQDILSSESCILGSKTRTLFERYYYDRPAFVDGTTEFHQLCGEHIPLGSEILEVGAGPDNPTSRHLASRYQVTGLDVSAEVMTNPALRRARVYDGHVFPFESRAFDGCVSNYVLEHVHDPAIHFAEVARVLKPGGVYCFRTPNRWHYVALAARMLPHSAHLRIANRVRGLSEDAHEPWPTVYRANTPGRVRRLCEGSGLEVVELRMIEKEPSYGRGSAVLFYPMMWYERVVNSSGWLRCIRANVLGAVRKGLMLRGTQG